MTTTGLSQTDAFFFTDTSKRQKQRKLNIRTLKSCKFNLNKMQEGFLAPTAEVANTEK